MRKMRYFSVLVIMLVALVATSFSGCAITTNQYKFYSSVVAQVGEVSITRADLIYAYNSYGYSYYVEQQGYTSQEAIEETLQSEIDKYILLDYIDSANITLELSEQAEVWNDIYDYLDTQLESYVEDAMDELGYDNIDGTYDDDSNVDADFTGSYESYTKRASITVVDGKITILSIDEEDEEPYTDIGYENYESSIKDTDILDMCKQLYAEDLYDSKEYLTKDNGDRYSSDTETAIEEEAQDIYDRQIEYALIEKFEEMHAENIYYSPSEIIEVYQNMVQNDYERYQLDPDSYVSDMTGDSADPTNVFYHLDSDMFYVYNVLLSFSDEQTTALSEQTALYECGIISEAVYDNYREVLVSQTVVNERDGTSEGNIVGTTNVEDVLNKVEAMSMNGILSSENIADLLNIYNTDPGMMNASTPYIDYEGNETYVTEFNEAGVELYDDGDGTVGEYSIAVTDYGIHIMIYAGPVDTSLTYSALQYEYANDITLYNLDSAIINPLTGQTMFDYMFDIVYPEDGYTGYSVFESAIIDTHSNEISVTIYTSVRDTTLTTSFD